MVIGAGLVSQIYIVELDSQGPHRSWKSTSHPLPTLYCSAFYNEVISHLKMPNFGLFFNYCLSFRPLVYWTSVNVGLILLDTFLFSSLILEYIFAQ
jgi:hypothetical protein